MSANSAPANGGARLPRPFNGPLAALGPKRLIQGLAVLGLAVAGLFGGLDRVDPAVTNVKVGENFNDGALDVTVKRARLVPELTAGDRVLMTAEPGTQYLAVVASLANDGTEPVPLERELDLRGVEQARKVAAFRLADGTSASTMGPGLSDDIGFVWQVPGSALHPGDTVTLRIWKKKYTQRSVLGGTGWVDSATDYGDIELPVGAPT